jgi:hypothetical protein
MRTLLFAVIATTLLLPPIMAAVADDRIPDAKAIEDVLRDALAGYSGTPHVLVQLRRATLIDVTVVDIEPLAPRRWRTRVTMLIDYGPTPRGILGYERLRIDEFNLDVARRDERLELVRLYRVYGVRNLIRQPAA